MKKIIFIMMILSMLLALTGCSESKDSDNKIKTGNSVEDVIQNQIDGDNSKETESKNVKVSEDGKYDYEASDVDIDLTQMSSDMVYATVYQMLADPDSYIGKTIRVKGIYYSNFYEVTSKYYFYIIITDALACCAQGIEFIWDDGNHVYPDEYPEDESEVVITGIFNTYTEENSDNVYCNLMNAEMDIVGN